MVPLVTEAMILALVKRGLGDHLSHREDHTRKEGKRRNRLPIKGYGGYG